MGHDEELVILTSFSRSLWDLNNQTEGKNDCVHIISPAAMLENQIQVWANVSLRHNKEHVSFLTWPFVLLKASFIIEIAVIDWFGKTVFSEKHSYL